MNCRIRKALMAVTATWIACAGCTPADHAPPPQRLEPLKAYDPDAHAEDPDSTLAPALVSNPAQLAPGACYETYEWVYLLPGMSKLPIAKEHARRVPPGAIIQCVNIETEFEGLWYSAYTWDAQGAAHFGYIDGEEISQDAFAPYTPAIEQLAAAPEPDSNRRVYAVRGASHYHEVSCTGLTVNAYPLPLKSAIEQGFLPCPRCKPPTLAGVSPRLPSAPTARLGPVPSTQPRAQPQPVQQPQYRAPQPSQQTGVTVYIAPYAGTKYHRSGSCRGLSNARSVESIPCSQAVSSGYTPCKLCKPQ